jgi:hydrogenase nickel incorporation protein HypB
MKIPVVRKILEANDQMAEELKATFAAQRILCLNLMSSPGAGKTTLLEQTLRGLSSDMTMAVIEGDVQTSNDAERIAATGAQAIQINTDGACHLDSSMVQEAVKQTDLEALDILFIENVGNLVCPAAFNVGEDFKVTVLSLPEGDDKPEKYPSMFARSELLLINKIDLLPYLEFDLDRAAKAAKTINPGIEVLTVSAKTGEGMEEWYAWLRDRRKEKQK